MVVMTIIKAEIEVSVKMDCILTEMGMLDCADLCCQVTNRFSIFICLSISVPQKQIQPSALNTQQ